MSNADLVADARGLAGWFERRLERKPEFRYFPHDTHERIAAYADRIEALEAEVARLREALQDIADYADGPSCNPKMVAHSARAAIRGETP